MPGTPPEPARDPARHAALTARLRAAGCVFAEEESDLLLGATSDPEALSAMVGRRVAGEPLEYVVGWVAFDGGRVAIDPGVFIPRQRTAYLVELAAARVAPGDQVLDLCCGSGALGLALARRIPGVHPHASDIDPVAVACAAGNLEEVGGVATTGDLFSAVPSTLHGDVAVVLANVPYVPTGAVALMPPEARDHEPVTTLDGGADGLDLLRRVAAETPGWLRPGGAVLCEVSAAQAAAAIGAFSAVGLSAEVHHDPDRETTVVSGTRLH